MAARAPDTRRVCQFTGDVAGRSGVDAVLGAADKVADVYAENAELRAEVAALRAELEAAKCTY